MPTTESLEKKILLDEIAGKNQAIHSYDSMLWVIRTGFLTLLFTGWGLVLSSKDIANLPHPEAILSALVVLSIVDKEN